MQNFPIRPSWSPLSIAAMVVGFIIWWPLGVAVLAWIIWGERMIAWWDESRHRFQVRAAGDTGNAAFEAYRKAELERLERERRRIEQEAEEFQAFMRELRKARDREEFDRFMAERRRRAATGEAGARPTGPVTGTATGASA
ncbi:uncharacterized protein DUF2852 [Tepidamorphus gemmatus]|uniref:Uncharacterized protein DUF2852 n=1 Tax=Tepidamorphus gemmatus TaxID=747076 RepID=A0A4R3MCK0_9HYPH|nr:DUF2852 domain-containing protein [Tepidamorphus gemmatus]TCT10583.1 uncharacterized protein DUF2852 [Tepidamorphus gemmatus]